MENDRPPLTRSGSADALWAALLAAGMSRDRLTLGDVWPQVASWMSSPVVDLEARDTQDFELLIVRAPREDDTATIVGDPPNVVGVQDFVAVVVSRLFKRPAGGVQLSLDGGHDVVLWYEATPAWTALRAPVAASWGIYSSWSSRDPQPLVTYVGASRDMQPARGERLLSVEVDGRVVVTCEHR